MKKSIYSKKNNSGRYTALLLVLFLLIASIIVFATITLLDPFDRGQHETQAPHTSAPDTPKDTTGEDRDTEPDLTENSVPESTAAPVVTEPPGRHRPTCRYRTTRYVSRGMPTYIRQLDGNSKSHLYRSWHKNAQMLKVRSYEKRYHRRPRTQTRLRSRNCRDLHQNRSHRRLALLGVRRGDN